MKKVAVLWIVITAVLVVLYKASVIPLAHLSPTLSFFNNGLHIPVYMLLVILFYFAWHNTTGKIMLSMVIAIACSGGAGILMEVVQAGIPGREMSVMDMALNAVGITAGITVLIKCRHLAVAQRTVYGKDRE